MRQYQKKIREIRIWGAFTLLLTLLGLSGKVCAQPVEKLPENPTEFITALVARLNATKTDEAKAIAPVFQKQWNETTFSEEEKFRIIAQLNAMINKKSQFFPEVTYYVKAISSIKNLNSYVQLDPKSFFDVTEQAIKDMEARRLRIYLKTLCDYVLVGNTCSRNKFSWHSSQIQPKLYYLEVKDEKETYKAPVIQFRKTDLNFRGEYDSTLIKQTSGEFNLMTRTFVGVGGIVDWAKMGEPGAYCQFRKYRLNFNIGVVTADSVTFYYNKMVSGKPIIGHFEDKNIGYKDINKAIFPYFKSYGGGVIIRDIVQGVHYQGGFSLKGIKAVGSSYDTLVKYVAPPPPPKKKKKVEIVKNGTSPEAEAEIDAALLGDFSEFGFDTYAEEESHAEDIDWFAKEEVVVKETFSEENFNDTTTYIPETKAVYHNPWDMVVKKIPAKVTFMRKDKRAVEFAGDEVILDQKSITGTRMLTYIFLNDTDSLVHPGTDLVFNTGMEELMIKRPTKGLYSRQPFLSTYHDFYFYFESILWEIGSDDVRFTAFIDQANKLSIVESFDFYSQQRFDSYKGILSFHPLGLIYRFTVEHEGESVLAESIIKAYGNPKTDLNAFKQALPRLASEGYIKYNPKNYEIFPESKLFVWMKAARKKKDFDVIQLVGSVEDKDNAVMDMSLDKLSVTMNGVQNFVLCDSQFVRIVPKDGEVVIGQNRNLNFGGTMAVGKMNFYADEHEKFKFDYESFNIFCDSIDSMRFILVRNPAENFEFSPLQKALRNTTFEKITGKIHIDEYNNKSGQRDDDGKQRTKYYPILDTYEKSYVYWEKDRVQQGIYKKDLLYFALDPFVLDSLSGFDERSLRFEGSFFSSDIFPEFRQALVVMPDNSLGMRNYTEAYGMDLYKGKGKYFNEINMDNVGLHGNGKIEYLETTTESDTFVFHFDSCMAVTKKFDMRRSYHVPEVSGNVTDFKWLVKQDVLAITTKEEPLKVFGGEATFEGTMYITPKSIYGNGTVTVDQVKISSDSVVFDEMEFHTFDGIFAITDDDTLDLKHFIAEKVNITYDVTRHETLFESKENGVARAFFPIHRYRASLNKGSYSRREKRLKMDAVSVYPLDNYFVSVNPDQDSLKFTAKDASYGLDIRNIEVHGVPVIIVADALITPPEGNVTIYPDGFIRKIENAIVEVDKETKFHKIYGAKVNIYSSKKYTGRGMYDYITVAGKPQYVKFDSIVVDKSRLVTVATGNIPDEQGFYLTDRIRFRGEAELDGSRKLLAFKGEVKIESENEVFKGAWFSFPKTIVNPDSIFIPISEDLSNSAGEELMVGLNFDKANQYFYSNFLQPKRFSGDLVVLRAKGGLTIDRKTKVFRIGPEEKLKGKTYKGTTVDFNDTKNIITSSGNFNNRFADFYKGTLSPKIAGSWTSDLTKYNTSTDLVMGLNYPVPAEPLKKFVEMFLYMSVAKKDVNYGNRQLIENLSEFIDADNGGDANTRKFEEEEVKNAIVSHDIDIGKVVPSSLLLSNVNFNFSETKHALYSSSEVGFLALNGMTINKMVGSKIVWQLGRENDLGVKEPDRLTILLEIDNYNYLYLEFFEYTVKIHTSYMDDVNVPLEAAILKLKQKAGEFHSEMATPDDVKGFRQAFKENFVTEEKK